MIRRIAVTAFFCLWHSGVQAVAEPVRIAYAEVFPPFTELKDGKGRCRLNVQFIRKRTLVGDLRVHGLVGLFEGQAARQRLSRATISTCAVWRNSSTGVTSESR
jgi:hypothetical protein